MTLLKREITIRYDAPLTAHWFNNDPFDTHFLNAYTLLIPDGEKFIIRSSRRFLSRLTPELREESTRLFYQEAQHSAEHSKVLDLLRDEGYKIDSFIAATNMVAYKICERVGPKSLLLATCSGIEHINASIAEFYLKKEPVFQGATKEMAQIFSWHFAEEIEHGCVVYDILQEVNSNYLLRVAGFLVAYVMFVPTLYLGAVYLAAQDGSLFRGSFWRGWFGFNFGQGFLKASLLSIWRYLTPSFHPKATLPMHLVEKGLRHYELHGRRAASPDPARSIPPLAVSSATSANG